MDFFVREKRGKGMKFIKTKTGIFYTITFLLIMVLSLSYASFKIITNEYKVTDLRIGNLMYGIEISSLGGEETISGNTVSLSSGKVTAVEIKINSLNSIISNYGVDYKITSGEGKVYYGSTTIDKVSDTIDNYNTSTTKIVKVFIEATTDITVEFNISGGYQYNTKVEEKTGYTRIAEMYTDSFKVTMNVTNGTSDAVSKTTTFNGNTTFTITPNDGYTLEEAEINCPGGTLTDNTLTINNIRKNITCEITLQEDGPFKSGTLAAQILKDNPTIGTRNDFSTPFTETTTGTIFTSTESITGITSTPVNVYYYAGNTTNNWVKFGGFYWRIIRTNHDGSIRLLYVGTSHDTTTGNIGENSFNTNNNSPKYVGYKYGEDTSLNTIRNNTTDSTIKTYIDTWYQNNLTNYKKYLSTSAVYCNDRSEETEGSYTTSNTRFNFASYKRLHTDKTPTYNCSDIRDAFSVENTSAKLDYPIALMTADEIVFAGGTAKYARMSTPYAWFISNSSGTQVSSSWWSLSPDYWYGSYAVGWYWYPGYASLDSVSMRGAGAVRPAISLKSCTLYGTGNGTVEKPYTIQETENGC